MVRDAMYITVPSYFRCPISMDVMKSPVSLCTGVTYDRSSIQHWLESGHDTCPATNLSLPSKDFVPNLTLHRLITLWSVPPSLSRAEAARLAGEVASRGGDWRRSLSGIADIAGGSGDVRGFLAESDGFVASVASILRDHHRDEIGVSETAVRILDLVLPESGVVEKLKKSIDLSSVLAVLTRGSARSRAGSARIVEAISASIGSESKRDAVAALVSALRSSADPELDEAAMSCLVSLSSASGSMKSFLAESGMVEIVTERLESDASAARLGLRLVREMATVAEGRAAIGGRCAAAAVERMMESPEDAVAAVWAMCCVYGDGRVQEAVRRSNGVTKVLLVMQACNGDGRLRRMCRELLKVLGSSRFGSSVLGSYHTKTAHIMPY